MGKDVVGRRLYNKIKKDALSPMDDEIVATRLELNTITVTRVRISDDYDDFLARMGEKKTSEENTGEITGTQEFVLKLVDRLILLAFFGVLIAVIARFVR